MIFSYLSRTIKFSLFCFTVFIYNAVAQQTPAQEYQKMFGTTNSGLSVMSADVSLVYRSRTPTSSFAYLQKPSWDASATVVLKNTTNSPMAVVGIDSAFSIGSCSPSNAEGITRTISGVGTIDPNYFQPNYPYAMPTGSFAQLAAQSILTVRLVLQGCSIESFEGDAPNAAVSISLGAMSPNTRLTRTDAVASMPKLQITK